VDAEARTSADYLQTLLDTDDGARILGEFAFGLNYEIDRWTRNILFDEKIGGTVHLALGSSFDSCGGKNQSALHWDIICDLRDEGEIYADGELVWRAGQFLEAPKPVAERV
jgi:aminopeptidase